MLVNFIQSRQIRHHLVLWRVAEYEFFSLTVRMRLRVVELLLSLMISIIQNIGCWLPVKPPCPCFKLPVYHRYDVRVWRIRRWLCWWLSNEINEITHDWFGGLSFRWMFAPDLNLEPELALPSFSLFKFCNLDREHVQPCPCGFCQ